MAAVEFHILSAAGDDARYRYACQLAEQAYDRDQSIFVRVTNAAEAQRMDELLWTFSDRAFIPHEIANADSPSHPRIRVLIGTDSAPEAYRALLINVAAELPAQLESYARIAEVVDADVERKRLARERYKQYRECGCSLDTKNL